MYFTEYQGSMLAQMKVDEFMREANHQQQVKLARLVRKTNKKESKPLNHKNRLAGVAR